MDQSVEEITHLGEVVARIIRANVTVEKLRFFGEDSDFLQVGMHERQRGEQLSPHIHLSNTKVVSEVHEVLYILSGQVKVTYYTIEGEVITQRLLGPNDILIHYRMGHGFEIIEDARIFEVKQGPYPGTIHAKIFLKNDQKPPP